MITIDKVHSNIIVHFQVESEEDLKIPYIVYGFTVKGESVTYRYVGQSYYGLKRRIVSHCSDCWKRTDNSKKANVMRKYKEITAFILYKCKDVYELDQKEREYIEEYHLKYGRSCLNTLLFIDKKLNRYSVNDIDPKFQIEQYDLKGNFTQTFPSIRDAERQLGICRSVISRAINRLSNTAGGFQWKRSNDSFKIAAVLPHCSRIILTPISNEIRKDKGLETKEEKKIREQKARGRKILQYDLNGKFIAEYPSLHEAEIQTRVNRKAISNCCNGQYIQSNGFQFRDKDSDLPVRKNLKSHSECTRKFNVKTKGMPIRQYDSDMNLIKEYDSVNQAKLATGFCGLGYYLNTNKTSHGFYWKTI